MAELKKSWHDKEFTYLLGDVAYGWGNGEVWNYSFCPIGHTLDYYEDESPWIQEQASKQTLLKMQKRA